MCIANRICWVALLIPYALWAQPKEIPFVVETMVLMPIKRFAVERRYIGTLKADKFSWLSPKSAGTVASIAIKPHQRVKKGQLLLSLKGGGQKGSVEIAQKSLALLSKELERNQDLFKTKDITKTELEKSEREVLAARQRLLEQERELENIEIRAPFDGVVGVPKVVLGESVDASKHVISIMEGDFSVFINVPSAKLAEIKEGQPIRVKTLQSTIAAVERSIDPVTRVGFAKASFKKCDFCIVGDSVFAHITVHEKNDALVIPKKAIYYQNAKPHVVVAVKNGDALKSHIQEIVVGEEQEDRVEVISGLKQNDLLVAANPKRIPEGATLTVAQ